MTISVSRDFASTDRYIYDSKLPSDFASLDTSEDASYYGNWASAKRLTLFSYCEGDCTTTVCTTAAEFKAEVEKFIAFCDRIGYAFKGIDPGWVHSQEVLQPWKDCGLSHLIH